eukprot:3932055-Pyramimonas_sp.AAC.1
MCFAIDRLFQLALSIFEGRGLLLDVIMSVLHLGDAVLRAIDFQLAGAGGARAQVRAPRR